MFAVTVSPPVNVADYVSSATTDVGLVVAAVLGAWFGFVVVRAGLRWAQGFADTSPYGEVSEGRYITAAEFAAMSEQDIDDLWANSDWSDK